MGFPTRSLGDILNNRKGIEEILRPAFYVFIVYKSIHSSFRSFILENFNYLHNISNEIVFFVIDYPRDWTYKKILFQLSEEKKLIDNIKNFMGELIPSLENIVLDYRNRYSHTEVLCKEDYEILRSILFEPRGIFDKIYTLKTGIYELWD